MAVAAASTDSIRPWERPWWYVAPGQHDVFLYLLAIHLLSVAGLVLFPIPGWPVFLLTLGLTLLGGLGTTVVYHRSISHSAVRLNPVIEQILVFFTVLNGSSTPRIWSANHRLHHAKSDTAEDISSPHFGGFIWAHIRCFYQLPTADVNRWTPDLAKRRYDIWTPLQPAIIFLSFFGPWLLFGWKGFFWAGAIRLTYSLHLQALVNSLMHTGPLAETGDSSRNVWWVGPFQLAAWGENWHRNHHSEAYSAKFARPWWQIDIGWYFIWALERLHLASDVRRPQAQGSEPALAAGGRDLEAGASAPSLGESAG